MRLTKIYSIIGLVIFATFFAVNSYAEEEKPEVEGKTVTLAKVNLQGAKIISQEGNTINISFNLNNREGAQSGVKYGIKLLEIAEGRDMVREEYVYPEILSLPSNSITEKTISFTPSFNIKGEYEVIISAKNYSGLPLGVGNLGKVTFTEQQKTVEIISETCSTFVEKSGNKVPNANTNTLVVSTNDKIFLNCVIKNNLNENVSITPKYETYLKTLYGEEVLGLPESKENITLRPLEEKSYNFSIPKSNLPQSYLTRISLQNETIKSNNITVSYLISGLSATIQNVSLDKNSYKANEKATISFFWTSSATNKEELTSISLKADIVNKNKRSCIESPINTQMAGVGFIEIPVTISKSCDDPEVTISLLDATGKILDQKALIFEANEKTNLFAGKMGIVAITILVLLVIAGLIIYFRNLKKKDDHHDDNHPKSGHIEGAMLTILFALVISFIPGGLAKADTYYVTASGVDYYYGDSYGYGTVIINANLDSSSYSFGDPMYLSSSISYDKYGWCSPFALYASHSSSYYEAMEFDGQNLVCGGDEYYAQNIIYNNVSSGAGAVYVSGDVMVGHTYSVSLNEHIDFSSSSSSSYTLYTSVSGSGSISWTPWDFINGCSASCSTSRPGGTYETFTATPSSGYTFAGWGGACAPYGTDTCYLTMDSDKTVSATFSPPQPTVTAYATNTNNGVTSADSITVDYGTAVDIKWTTSNTSSCTCTSSTGGSCTNPSYGDKIQLHTGGTFYPTSTTTYYVNCN